MSINKPNSLANTHYPAAKMPQTSFEDQSRPRVKVVLAHPPLEAVGDHEHMSIYRRHSLIHTANP